MATSFAHGQKLCAALAKALNVTRPVRSIIINAHCSSVASVTIEFVPTAEEAETMAKIVEEYKVEETPTFKGSWRDNPQL
jgi:hypothetical protein